MSESKDKSAFLRSYPVSCSMNFLSHYYFDRSASPYQILGSVLPDLIKNAGKSPHLHPLKSERLFSSKSHKEILEGWERHLLVDKVFHSDNFFITHTASLKNLLKPIVGDTEIRPSFLAHIALELLLDHLLIEKNLVQPAQFYQALDYTNKLDVAQFLAFSGAHDPEQIMAFIEKFSSSRYLFSYQKIENLSYALNRICMRLWPVDLPQQKISAITEQLILFKKDIDSGFISIFDEIASKLN